MAADERTRFSPAYCHFMATNGEIPDRVSGVSRRQRWVRRLLMAVGLGCVWLWAVEAWFRPAWCCRVPEWVWLAGCLIAAGALAWLGARKRPVGLLAALPLARWLAVGISAVVIRADFTVCKENIYSDGMGFSPESQIEWCLDFSPACRRLLAVYLGVPKDMELPSCFDMVACSRPGFTIAW